MLFNLESESEMQCQNYMKLTVYKLVENIAF
jgi:hypothetical protein